MQVSETCHVIMRIITSNFRFVQFLLFTAILCSLLSHRMESGFLILIHDPQQWPFPLCGSDADLWDREDTYFSLWKYRRRVFFSRINEHTESSEAHHFKDRTERGDGVPWLGQPLWFKHGHTRTILVSRSWSWLQNRRASRQTCYKCILQVLAQDPTTKILPTSMTANCYCKQKVNNSRMLLRNSKHSRDFWNKWNIFY